MPCGPTCACLGTGVECLSVVDPTNFGYFAEHCRTGTEHQRRTVLGRSRIGLNPVQQVQQAATVVVPLAISLKRREAILACPYRGERVSCGCGDLRHCSGRYGPWQASYNECVDCVTSHGDAHP
jgi:hypothetical protein